MCRLFKITGRVQGVFFRASTYEAAVQLNLNGHAINLPDGSVEVRACGDDAAVEQLREWLQSGPRHAAVHRVEEIATNCSHPQRFRTG